MLALKLLSSTFGSEKFPALNSIRNGNADSKLRPGKTGTRRDITKEIREEYSDPDEKNDNEIHERVERHFANAIIPLIREELIDNLLNQFFKLISEDESILGEKRNTLLALAKPETLAEFLAETFIYAINQNNSSEADEALSRAASIQYEVVPVLDEQDTEPTEEYKNRSNSGQSNNEQLQEDSTSQEEKFDDVLEEIPHETKLWAQDEDCPDLQIDLHTVQTLHMHLPSKPLDNLDPIIKQVYVQMIGFLEEGRTKHAQGMLDVLKIKIDNPEHEISGSDLAKLYLGIGRTYLGLIQYRLADIYFSKAFYQYGEKAMLKDAARSLLYRASAHNSKERHGAKCDKPGIFKIQCDKCFRECGKALQYCERASSALHTSVADLMHRCIANVLGANIANTDIADVSIVEGVAYTFQEHYDKALQCFASVVGLFISDDITGYTYETLVSYAYNDDTGMRENTWNFSTMADVIQSMNSLSNGEKIPRNIARWAILAQSPFSIDEWSELTRCPSRGDLSLDEWNILGVAFKNAGSVMSKMGIRAPIVQECFLLGGKYLRKFNSKISWDNHLYADYPGAISELMDSDLRLFDEMSVEFPFIPLLK